MVSASRETGGGGEGLSLLYPEQSKERERSGPVLRLTGKYQQSPLLTTTASLSEKDPVQFRKQGRF